jgi:hypothetical protein
MNLNPFLDWAAAEGESRGVNIEIRGSKVEVWAWDNKLMQGQLVQDVSEIDIPAVVEKQDREKFAILSKKYGGEQTLCS